MTADQLKDLITAGLACEHPAADLAQRLRPAAVGARGARHRAAAAG